MKVILREDVEKLGKAGDLVNVAEGYGRNYLIPKGLAIEATEKSLEALEEEKKKILARHHKERIDAEKFANRLSEMVITIPHQAGEEEKLFGSVTAKDIADAIAREGMKIDKRKISLQEPIKRLGNYTVTVKLHPDVSVELKVFVVRV